MLSKGEVSAINSSMYLLLGVMALAVLAGALYVTVFPEGEEFLGLIDRKIDSRTDVKSDDQLSALARYVSDQARDEACREGGLVDQNSQKGFYKALTGTHLTGYPTCSGKGASVVTRTPGAITGGGEDDEGRFSREYFKIEDKVTLVVSGGSKTDTWLEKHLYGASRNGFYQSLMSKCSDKALKKVLGANFVSQPFYFGTDRQFILFFKDQVGRRTNYWLNKHDHLSKRTYCGQVAGVVENNIDVNQKKRITLCKGDKGYIQVNKGAPSGKGPHNTKEASELTLANLPSSKGAKYYPYIQITESGGCSSVDYKSVLDQPFDSFKPASDKIFVMEKSGENLVLRPKETDERVSIVWSLEKGDKKVEFKVRFRDQGHVRMEARNRKGLVTNINTDARGKNFLWMYCYVCGDSDFRSGNYQGKGYGKTGFTYQEDRDYSIELIQQGQKVGWKIKSGGQVVWKFMKEMNGFTEVRLEFYEEWQGGKTDKPVVVLKDVKISYE